MATPFDNPRDWFRSELSNFFREFADTSGTQRPTARGRRSRSAGAFPPVNIYDDGESFRLRAELPGVNDDDLEISAKDDQIVIRGERSIEPPEENANWHRRERQGGNFRRTVTLPEPIDPDNVQATLKLGVLNIFAPRSPQSKPRQIEVNG